MTAKAPSRHLDQLARLRAAMAAPSGRVTVVNVPMGNFLMVEGRGDAASEPFRCAVRTLAEISAGLRLYLQEGDGDLYDPMPLEILWSTPEDGLWHEAIPSAWSWTAMVAQPPRVRPELVAALREKLAANHQRETLCQIHLGSLREGLCAQIAHRGPLLEGRRVLDRLVDEARSLGYQPHGPHHEIYLADLRHRDAGPLRIIVRQPIHPAA